MGKYKPRILIEQNVPSQQFFFWQLDYYLNFINTKNKAEGDNSLEDIAS